MADPDLSNVPPDVLQWAASRADNTPQAQPTIGGDVPSEGDLSGISPDVLQWAASKENGAQTPSATVGNDASEFTGNFMHIPRGTEDNPMPISQVLEGAAANAIPSTARANVDLVQPFLHPVQTYNGVSQLIKGLESKIKGLAVNQDPAQKAEDEKLLNAFIDTYKDKYSFISKGDWEGFKYYLANDPATFAVDLASLATGVGVAAKGVGVAAKAAQLAKIGEMAGAVEKTAGTVSKYASAPLMPATYALSTVAAPVVGAAAKLAAPAAEKAAQGAAYVAEQAGFPQAATAIREKVAPYVGYPGSTAIVDSAGNFTPEVQKVISDTYGTRLSPDDLEAIKPQIVETMQNKGINADALNEALLQSSGVEPVSVKTSEIKTKKGMQEAQADNVQSVVDRAAQAAGPAPLSPTALGEVLETEQVAAKNRIKTAYDNMDAVDGVFHPMTFNGIGLDIEAGLKSNKIPSLDPASYPTKQVPVSVEGLYPNTQSAIEMIQKDLTPIKTENANIGDLTIPNVNIVRKKVNDLWESASPTDRRGLDVIRNALDNRMGYAFNYANKNPSVFYKQSTGGPLSPQELATARNALRDANAAHADYAKTFTSSDNVASAAISRAVRQLQSGQVYDLNTGRLLPSGNQAIQQTAQGILLKSLSDPKSAALMYDKLNAAFSRSPQAQEALRSMVANSVINVPPLANGAPNVSGIVKSIDTFFSPQGNKMLADRIFSPDEKSQFARISESLKLIDNSNVPSVEKAGLTRRVLSGAAQSAFTLAGHFLIDHVIPIPLAGAAVGYAAERGLEHLIGPKGTGTQLNVAPNRPLSSYVPSSVSKAAQSAALPTAIFEENKDPLPPLTIPGGRVPRKSGGKVQSGHQHLVDRLFRLGEQAKKTEKSHTEPLLKLPDETVAKALDVAQRAI